MGEADTGHRAIEEVGRAYVDGVLSDQDYRLEKRYLEMELAL